MSSKIYYRMQQMKRFSLYQTSSKTFPYIQYHPPLHPPTASSLSTTTAASALHVPTEVRVVH